MDDVVAMLRDALLDRSFGAVRFWKFAPIRPMDQRYRIVSTHRDGDRLDLVYVHESRQGLAAVISIEAPEGVTVQGTVVQVARARRLRMGDFEAVSEGDQYLVKTPRGEGRFAIDGVNALTLEL